MTKKDALTPLQRVIRERRSVKKGYNDEEVTETFMRKLLEDARWAPNHLMRQLWRFIFVGQKELPEFAKKVAQTYPEKQHKKTHKGFRFLGETCKNN